MTERKVGFIGAGLMAEALGGGMLRAGMVRARGLAASDPSEERRRTFAQKLGARTFESNVDLMRHAEIVVLSVKPQMLPDVAAQIAPSVTPSHLIVSIVPGVTLGWLSEKLGTDRVVRVMPNTPTLVGEGAAGLCCGEGIEPFEQEFMCEALSVEGICHLVPEKLMDAVNGLSGSGPAYVYMMIEALSDGGVKMGLPRATATELAAQTVLGAAKMVLETGKHPGELKDMVATPGGTTIEGIHALERARMRQAFMDAVEAGTLKCKVLRDGAG